jgi:hypothetical protein
VYYKNNDMELCGNMSNGRIQRQTIDSKLNISEHNIQFNLKFINVYDILCYVHA